MAIRLVNKRTDNPRLISHILKDGRVSLDLLFTFGYTADKDIVTASGQAKRTLQRKRKSLGLYLIENARTKAERAQNEETLRLAYKLRDEACQKLLEDKEGYRVALNEPNLLDYFQNFVDKTACKDIRLLKAAFLNFRRFLEEDYPQFSMRLEPKQINKKMMQDFAYYIEDNHKGEGVRTYWQRFKRIINHFVEEERLIKSSPCRGVKITFEENVLRKDVLSMDEIKKLFDTHYNKENPEIRRAFAFTCFTGIRGCDTRKLTYKDIDYSNKVLTIKQSKVDGHSKNATLQIPMSDTVLGIVGKKPEGAKMTDLVFNLPSDTMCNKALKHWTAKAGIEKHITWYCGRHSYATNVLSNGANQKVVSELLGHSSMKYTERYIRALDELKKEAVNSIGGIDINNI